MALLRAGGRIESRVYNQAECVGPAVQPARAEGIVPAPEANHAVKGAIDEALRCKTEGKSKVILFNASGHGHFDLGSYDAYHRQALTDYKLEEAQIERAGKDRLLAFHVCDWLTPTTDMLNDRGMMGDGVIDLKRIRGWIEGAGYRGFHEVEIFSKANWWRRDPDEVLATLKARHRRCS